MGSVSVPINNDSSNVQPGWIYLKDEGKFYPSNDKGKWKIENTPCIIKVKEFPQDKLIKLTDSVVNSKWQKDLICLSKDQSCKMIYCMLTKTKVIKPLNQQVIDYDYASEVYYCNGIMAMLKFNKKYKIPLEKIQYILNQLIVNSKVSSSDLKDAFEHILSVDIYHTCFKSKTHTYRPSASQAFEEIIDVFKFFRKNDNFESIEATVRILPPNVKNLSVLKCGPGDGTSKSVRNRSLVRKLWDAFMHGTGILSADYEEIVDSNRDYAVKVLVSIIEDNPLNHDYQTTYQMDYCNQHMNSLDNNNIADKQSNGNFNVCVRTKSESPNSVTNWQGKENANTQANAPQSSIYSNIFSDLDIHNPAPRKSLIDTQTFKNSYESIIAQTKVWCPEAGTLSQGTNVTKNCKASSEMADAETNKLRKKNKIDRESSKDVEMASPLKKVQLQPGCRSDVESGLTHHYYYDTSFEGIGKSFTKTLLLFGTDDPGKLSLLNLLFHCSQLDENLKARQIVDVASDVESISFYHFLSHGESVEELIVIITPKLTAPDLANLKELLSNGILNVNALGFVVNSRSETLTSEERGFFNFIRTSFGEVSNHHLMTFLSFCDFSRNFPVLEAMKQLSIKSKCTLELYCCELILNDVSEPSDNWRALIPREFKKGKKVYKYLKEMPLMSVKSMKIAQEKSFAETHCAESSKQLVVELEQFATLVKDGKDIKENVKPLWRLARLVFTLEGNENSEKNLLEFMTKVLAGIEPDIKPLCFFLLLLNSPERNITATLKSTLNYFKELIFSLYDNSDDIPECTVLLENNKVAQVCNNCKDVERCDRETSDEHILPVKCIICSCPAKSRSLLTFQDSGIFFQSLCDVAMTAIRDLCDELPRKHFVIQFPLFLACLSNTYPEYEMLLKTIQSQNLEV